ncbi:MAG: transcription initiation factor IIB [Thermoprotei archaeon]|nr:MAG: transcription initiation factor IIB [Thermoprotei archaeon]
MVIRPSEPSPEDILSRCPSGNIVFDEEHGEWICADTGEVIAERVIDRGPEWRAFTAEEKERRSRAGAPLTATLHDSGLSTVIDWHDRDATGKKLDLKKRLELIRMRKWQTRTRIQSSIDRNLAQAINELERIAEQLGLPRLVREEAAIIYRKAVEKELVRGRAIECVVAAALYAACRLHRIPRTLDEIAKYTRCGRKEVARCYRLLVRELDLRVPLVDPADYAQRIASILGLSGFTIKTAIEIIEKAKRIGITAGKDPAGVAAAAVYIAALLNDERRTQKEVAAAAGVTEVTVRNRYKELIRILDMNELQKLQRHEVRTEHF